MAQVSHKQMRRAQSWTGAIVALLAVAALAWFTNVLAGFLGRDAAAGFVALMGFVFLTFPLPQIVRRAVYGMIGLALAALVYEVLGVPELVLGAALAAIFGVLDKTNVWGPQRTALHLAALGLIFALGYVLVGVQAGLLFASIVALFFAAAFKLPERMAEGVYGALGVIVVADVLSIIGLEIGVPALVLLALLLLYQPDTSTWTGRIIYVAVFAALFGLGIWQFGPATGLLLGAATNIVLISTPSEHSDPRRSLLSWERGVFSRLELQAWQGRLMYRLIMITLLVLAVTVAFPFAYAFTAGLKESNAIYTSGLKLWPSEPLWETYQAAWERFDVLRLFKNTVVIVVTGMIFQIGVSTLAAYSLSRLKPKGGRYIMLGFLVTLMIPSIAYMVPLYVTVARLPIFHVSLLGSYWGIWLPGSVNAFQIFVLKNFFDALPSELFDAAKVDGANALQILRHIALPLSRPILIVLSILTFVGMWKDFLWPYLILLTERQLQPISVYLFEVTTTSTIPLNEQMAGYFLAMVPPLVIAILLQRYMRQGLSMGAVKG
ncbi:MAG TPA: carbohydrate ABC transporter permease [Aggregatilinea sp.]|uniref:carbohydrate ABC transporter permease n=1 Tax=Aggregatilinea sp. TaxID=2806333 RepID=UPI002CBEB9A3|nr:carbohydrate ABC transporter permease [Aggregatilinea sp.]HML21414.1 carbohydrate ABC transporter permease [Aggregatilinea sp.]